MESAIAAGGGPEPFQLTILVIGFKRIVAVFASYFNKLQLPILILGFHSSVSKKIAR